MRLKDLLEKTPHTLHGDDKEITGLQYDSRKVQPGDLFFCIRGYQTDGHRFAPNAAAAGAAALIVEEPLDLDVTQVVVPDARAAMAQISAAFYGYPAEKMRMIGITGTNGKTSVTYMLKSIFEEMGEKVGLIGTIVNLIGDTPIHTERTTPESMDLQALLARMVEEGVGTVVMEVSSHSLALHRTLGVRFNGSIFTNLTQDHLDFHKDFDDYAQAKRRLFAQSDISAINMDDPRGTYMKEGATGKPITFGIKSSADYMARDIDLTPEHARFVLAAENFRVPIVMQIPGMFTVYNALAAAALCIGMGIDLMPVKKGLEKLQKVAGRFERLDTHGRDYSVILDYCHSPDSLESTLKTVRGFAEGRIVCVFGCGGNRDATKRPIMGGIAGKLADFSVVTSDNPRFEEPMSIIDQIRAGMEGASYITIENRREAIRYALENAQPKDVIVLAGKGHEDYQEICGVKHPFDEKVVVEELLKELEAEGK